jgi:hypothetical protein
MRRRRSWARPRSSAAVRRACVADRSRGDGSSGSERTAVVPAWFVPLGRLGGFGEFSVDTPHLLVDAARLLGRRQQQPSLSVTPLGRLDGLLEDVHPTPHPATIGFGHGFGRLPVHICMVAIPGTLSRETYVLIRNEYFLGTGRCGTARSACRNAIPQCESNAVVLPLLFLVRNMSVYGAFASTCRMSSQPRRGWSAGNQTTRAGSGWRKNVRPIIVCDPQRIKGHSFITSENCRVGPGGEPVRSPRATKR